MTTLRQACEDTRSRCGTSLSLEVESRRGGIKTRRDMLFALWVARRLRYDRDQQEAFAWSVHFAGFSDEALVAEATRLFDRAGRPMPARQVFHQLREMQLRAFLHLSAAAPAARVRRRDGNASDTIS